MYRLSVVVQPSVLKTPTGQLSLLLLEIWQIGLAFADILCHYDQETYLKMPHCTVCFRR